MAPRTGHARCHGATLGWHVSAVLYPVLRSYPAYVLKQLYCAAVLGSGCGVAGGGIVFNSNGGWPPTGMHQGQDPLSLLDGPKSGPVTMWPAGTTQTVRREALVVEL